MTKYDLHGLAMNKLELASLVSGTVLVTLSASMDSLRPPQCRARPCPQATGGQTWLLYGALALIALGTGGIKPCVSTFGADQLDEADKKEVPKKYAFFNWFFLAINMGVLFGITGHGYFHRHFSSWHYRFQKPMGSPFTRFAQVLWASVRNHLNGVRAGHQTEPFELSTFFISQANIMDRKLFCPHLQRHQRPRSCAVQKVFTCAGQLECFYDEATDGTRSISGAMFLSEIGIGSSFSAAIVKIIQRATGGEEKGWLRNNLNLSKLDYFYWVLTSINAVNLAVYVWIVVLYKGRDGVVGV
ncbi:hypothetical protein OIU84_005199 [Salix udensis]|uniref:Uncharacterized protein n=1 Tax=Salix udensis TaxID=889485 RepID=A0AAD6JVQ1_9ROSI|nr:hypothetical protein OIU84_005199 [Salix udensis]